MQDPIFEAFQRVKTDITMLTAKLNVIEARQAEVETITQKKLVGMVKEQNTVITALKNQVARQERTIESFRKKKISL